jgi:hypothetical protein
MSASIEERLPELFDSAKGGQPDAPRDVYRRLQFLSRVMRRAPAVSAADAMLLWHDEERSVKSANIPAAGVIIGRDQRCDIVLPDRRVSRRHIHVGRSEGEFEVKDLHSSNGTLVNGVRIVSAHVLQDGDVIEIGGTPLAFVCRTADL